MANNSSIDTNQLNVSYSSNYKPEGCYMITEGRLDHIESIVSQIEKYEKWEPKWDLNKNIMSACGAITLRNHPLTYYRDNDIKCCITNLFNIIVCLSLSMIF